MKVIQLLLFVFILIILFVLINLMMNYISRRDGEPSVAIRKKLWLIPLFTACIIIPLELFAMLYTHWFPMHSSAGLDEPLAYSSQSLVLGFPLMLLIGFLIFEGLIHPLVITLLRLRLRKDTSIYTKQVVTVVTDTVLLYIASLFIPGIPVGSWLQSFLIIVSYHLIEWILIGIQTWIHQRKRAKAGSIN